MRTFRDLTQLPRSGLARRFGKALLLELDLALGRQPELRPWFEAPLQFASTLELFADVEHAEALLFAARRQLCELAGWLAARHAAVRYFVLEARHDRTRRSSLPGELKQGTGPVTLIEARFASPAHDVERMLAVLRERLAIIRLPGAVHTLHLRCEEIVPADTGDRQLFPVAASTEENLGRLVERLQARLGRDQVQRLLLAEDHRPEAAYRIESVADSDRPMLSSPAAMPSRNRGTGSGVAKQTSSRATTRPALSATASSSPATHPTILPTPSSAPSYLFSPVPASLSWSCAPRAGQMPRPLWLLHKPIALRERNQRPWWRGPLKLLSSPERIEGGWWDCNLVQRDYFIAEDDHAQWFWIYRTRGSSESGNSGEGNAGDANTSWYLQGIFG